MEFTEEDTRMEFTETDILNICTRLTKEDPVFHKGFCKVVKKNRPKDDEDSDDSDDEVEEYKFEDDTHCGSCEDCLGSEGKLAEDFAKLKKVENREEFDDEYEEIQVTWNIGDFKQEVWNIFHPEILFAKRVCVCSD